MFNCSGYLYFSKVTDQFTFLLVVYKSSSCLILLPMLVCLLLRLFILAILLGRVSKIDLFIPCLKDGKIILLVHKTPPVLASLCTPASLSCTIVFSPLGGK